jgi:hypothetical protein
MIKLVKESLLLQAKLEHVNEDFMSLPLSFGERAKCERPREISIL